MLTRGLICLGMTVGVSIAASAQPVAGEGNPVPGTPAAAAAAGAAGDATGTTPTPKAQKPRTGDVITLKSGRVLSGVQVLRETASRVEVQVLEGDAPLAILKKQIEKIERDDIEPGKSGRVKPADDALVGESAEVIINASKIPSELNQKLTQPLADTVLQGVNGQDYVAVLEQISMETGVPIQIAEELSALPAEQRIWNGAPATGTTLFTLLLDDFRAAFPDTAIVYEEDGLHIRMRPNGANSLGVAPVGLPPIEGAPTGTAPVLGTPQL